MAQLDYLSATILRDATGAPYLGAKAYYWSDAGATTPLTTYSDAGLTSANANPVVSDGTTGAFGAIYLQAKRYWRTVKTSADVSLPQFNSGPIDGFQIFLTSSAAPAPAFPFLRYHNTTDGHTWRRDSTNSSWIDEGLTDSLGSAGKLVNYQAGTSYTILTTDRGALVSHGNAAAVSVTLPQANGTTFPNGWYVTYANTGAGEITITPNTSTINGAATLILQKGQQADIVSDGTNYRALLSGSLGKATIWVPAQAIIARTTAGAAPATVESATNRIMRSLLDFDQTTQEHAQFTVAMPKGWNESTVTAQFIWECGVTGNVVWGLQGLASSDDDVIDSAFGTGVEVTDGVTATTDLMVSAETAAITIGGTPAESDVVTFQVYRNAGSGSDTAAGDARLRGVRLFLTYDALTDR